MTTMTLHPALDRKTLFASFWRAWKRDSARGLTRDLDFEEERGRYLERVCTYALSPSSFDPTKAGAVTYLRLLASQSLSNSREWGRRKGRELCSVGDENDVCSPIEGKGEDLLEDHDTLVEQTEDHERVWAALSVLSERERAVVLGRLEGEHFDVIGERLSCSRQRAQQLWVNALSKMRLHLGVEL